MRKSDLYHVASFGVSLTLVWLATTEDLAALEEPIRCIVSEAR